MENKQPTQQLSEVAREMLYSSDPVNTLEQKTVRQELPAELLASAEGLGISAKLFKDRTLSDQERIERLFLALQKGEINQQFFAAFAGVLAERIQKVEQINRRRTKLDRELQQVNQQNKELAARLQELETEFHSAKHAIVFLERLLQRWQGEYANAEPERAREALRKIFHESADSVPKTIPKEVLKTIGEFKLLGILPGIEKQLGQLPDAERADYIVELIQSYLALDTGVLQKNFEADVNEVATFKKKLLVVLSDWLQITAVVGAEEQIEALNQVITAIDNTKIRTMLQKALRPEEGVRNEE